MVQDSCITEKYQANHTIADIARQYYVSRYYIQKVLDKSKIKRKNFSEIQLIINQRKNKLHRNKDWLYKKYCIERLPRNEIAKLCHVSSSAIKKVLGKFKLKRKKGQIAVENLNPIYKNIYHEYVENKLTAREIAIKYDTSCSVVRAAIKRNNIQVRPRSYSRTIGLQFWKIEIQKGFDASEPREIFYDRTLKDYSNKFWKPKILTRDNFTCQECGDNHFGNLQAHHIIPINYIKDCILIDLLNCNTKNELFAEAIKDWRINDLDNGLTLCKTCHWSYHRNKKPKIQSISIEQKIDNKTFYAYDQEDNRKLFKVYGIDFSQFSTLCSQREIITKKLNDKQFIAKVFETKNNNINLLVVL